MLHFHVVATGLSPLGFVCSSVPLPLFFLVVSRVSLECFSWRTGTGLQSMWQHFPRFCVYLYICLCIHLSINVCVLYVMHIILWYVLYIYMSTYKVNIIILISQKKLSLKEDMSFPQGHWTCTCWSRDWNLWLCFLKSQAEETTPGNLSENRVTVRPQRTTANLSLKSHISVLL